MKRTGSEIVTEILVREGVPYAIGIAGHGNLALVEAFRRYQDRIQVIMPRHEQAAVHMADAYCRVKGEPLAVFASIGAGASNTALGLATAAAAVWSQGGDIGYRDGADGGSVFWFRLPIGSSDDAPGYGSGAR